MSDKIKFVTLSDYTTPEVTEVKNRDWVGYGEDNNYFGHLINLYHSSPTNNAIINGMAELIYGGGLDAKDKVRKPDEYAALKSMFKEEDVRRIVVDLKLMGNAAIQVVYAKGKKRIERIEHFPVETLRATKADEDGNILSYLYCADWENAKPNDKHESFPSFGNGTNSELNEIFYVKPYRSGFFYYSPVDYQGSTPYCEIEAEVANYHINNIQNGFSPSFLINFNSGVPDERTQTLIEKKIISKYGGSSNAGRAIIAFNDDKEQAATIEAIQLSDADKQYQFIADESMRKIMLGHRITSPMLLGIKDNSGLGNNADELKTASMLFEATVINPFRILLLNAFEKILAVNDVSLNIYFKSLNPFEVEDANNEDTQLSKQELSSEDVDDEFLNHAAAWLIEQGDDIGDDFEEIDVEDLLNEEDEDDFNDKLNALELKLSSEEGFFQKLARAVYGNPKRTSEQDTTLFKVRYRYAPHEASKQSKNSREFCKKMVKASKIYRKEDIEAAGSLKVNAGLGKGGADTYSIWLYKGGARCHHFWQRVVYMRKNNKKMTVNQARKLINELKPSQRKDAKWEQNDKKVAKRPVDMPNEGFVTKKK